ncbi:MAG: hypothetical protein ACRDKZ_09675, partial [Actinomycetota bacterium]
FRITAWCALVLGVLAVLAARAALDGVGSASVQRALVLATLAGVALYLLVQYSNTDVPGVVIGYGVGVLGALLLSATGMLIADWPGWLAALQLSAGAVLLGAVTNGMMLGHWYLNQPGLKPWALARLTNLALGASIASAAIGLVAAGKLAGATLDSAALGIPSGQSFGLIFYAAWLALVVFTGAVIWMARRCIAIKSIQSATGLYYVAILTAGVAEFLVRYLMLNAA